MRKHRLPLIGLVVLGISLGGRPCAVAAGDEPANNGEDVTKTLDRLDIRLQGKALPDATESGQTFSGRNEETLTLRSDLMCFAKPDQLALRIDLPLIWSNKPTSENPNGATDFGMGDLLLQAVYVRTFTARWAGAIGLRSTLPTATGQAFGDGRWQLAPTVAVRAELPEISAGSYAGLIVRENFSMAGSASRKNISQLIIEPQMNIGLLNRWFLNTSPKIYFDQETSKWFVPLDLMIGKKFGTRWIASVEYQYGLVRGDDRYNQWLELRVGYFF